MVKGSLMVIMVCFVMVTNAQSVETDSVDSITTSQNLANVKYFLSLYSGPLISCKDCVGGRQVTSSTALVQGVTVGNRLRMGIGVGFDSYIGWQVMPVFVSGGFDVIGNKDKNAVFVQFNYGWTKPWLNDQLYYDYGNTKVTGGRMVHSQIGYRLKYGDIKISIAVGHKYQRLYSYYEYPSFIYDFNGRIVAGEPSRRTVRESLSRLAVTVGIGWR